MKLKIYEDINISIDDYLADQDTNDLLKMLAYDEYGVGYDIETDVTIETSFFEVPDSLKVYGKTSVKLSREYIAECLRSRINDLEARISSQAESIRYMSDRLEEHSKVKNK